jgi:hypothetical protein
MKEHAEKIAWIFEEDKLICKYIQLNLGFSSLAQGTKEIVAHCRLGIVGSSRTFRFS